jgi:hypothetical protein
MGRPPVMPQRTARLQPVSFKSLAVSLPTRVFHTISWREGTNEPLRGREAFASEPKLIEGRQRS